MIKYIDRRNIQFKKKIYKSDKSRILGVAIDPSTSFHKVIIFNFDGKLLMPSFEIDTLRPGYNHLVKQIKKCAKKIKSKEIYIAIEIPSGYAENFINKLQEDFKNVVFISSVAVAANRKEKSLRNLKTDLVDAKSISDLLIRGEHTRHYVSSGIYFQLRELIYWRQSRRNMVVKIRNQIMSRMERLYPGLNKEHGIHKKLGVEFTRTKMFRGFINACMSREEFLNTPNDKLFQIFKYKYHGEKYIGRIKDRLKNVLPCEPEFVKVELDIMRKDVKLFNYLEEEIKNIEESIVKLGKMTPAKYMMNQIKGINEIHASIYIGLVGDIRSFKSAAQIYSRAGLNPIINQSGGKNLSHVRISRAGNKLLRTTLFAMASCVIVHNTAFREYFLKLQKRESMHWKERRIAVINKLNRVMFAMMRDKSDFDSDLLKPLNTRD